MNSPSRKRALVLSGGGGRGAYQVGVLRFLEKHEWWPDIYVGTSIGAVNAAAMVSGHTSYSLWSLWHRLKTDDVQCQSWSLFSLDKWDHLLDTSPLRRTLIEEKWIDLERINAPSPQKHLRITTVEVGTGRLCVFGNSPDVTSGTNRCIQDEITVDHILASCSIPMVYPATEIDGVRFWDGGVIANTPLGPAIDAGAEEIIVVLMTPWESAIDRPKYQPSGGIKGLLSAGQAAFEWALLASFQADLKLFKRTNEVVRVSMENERLRAENERLKHQLEQRQARGEKQELVHREVEPPIIISPSEPISLAQILQYEPQNHESLYQMGFADAERAWAAAGRRVE